MRVRRVGVRSLRGHGSSDLRRPGRRHHRCRRRTRAEPRARVGAAGRARGGQRPRRRGRRDGRIGVSGRAGRRRDPRRRGRGDRQRRLRGDAGRRSGDRGVRARHVRARRHRREQRGNPPRRGVQERHPGAARRRDRRPPQRGVQRPSHRLAPPARAELRPRRQHQLRVGPVRQLRPVELRRGEGRAHGADPGPVDRRSPQQRHGERNRADRAHPYDRGTDRRIDGAGADLAARGLPVPHVVRGHGSGVLGRRRTGVACVPGHDDRRHRLRR